MFGLNKVLKRGKKLQSKELFEAMVAGLVYSVCNDGDFSRDDQTKVEKLLGKTDSLSAFGKAEISRAVAKWADAYAEGKVSATRKMLKELDDIADNADQAEEVMAAIVDAVYADGDVNAGEKKAMEVCASRLRLNLSDFLPE